jgi:4-hydroxy-2-oxoheptanedioate aldolase
MSVQVRGRGLWVTCLGPFALEAALRPEVDWVGLDLQHGALRLDDVAPLLRVTQAAGTPALVRLPSDDRAVLGRVLDEGPHGVIVPAVESGAQASAVVAGALPPPRGSRSTGLGRTALGLPGVPTAPLVLVMVETAAGLRACAEIVATEGLDGVFVGPYDLALSLGAGGTTEPEVLAAVREVLTATRAAGGLTGYFAGDPGLAALLPEVDLLAVDSDVAALRAGVAARWEVTR